MTIKKTLTTAACGLAMLVGLAGCGKENYDFEGKIGNETVQYQKGGGSISRKITVIRAEGGIVKYMNYWPYNGVDEIEITKDGKTTSYANDSHMYDPLFEEAQRKFSEYLKKIGEIQSEKALRDLRGE